jgi:hypothetical protein
MTRARRDTIPSPPPPAEPNVHSIEGKELLGKWEGFLRDIGGYLRELTRAAKEQTASFELTRREAIEAKEGLARLQLTVDRLVQMVGDMKTTKVSTLKPKRAKPKP